MDTYYVPLSVAQSIVVNYLIGVKAYFPLSPNPLPLQNAQVIYNLLIFILAHTDTGSAHESTNEKLMHPIDRPGRLWLCGCEYGD